MGRSQVCRQGNLGTLFVLTSISLVLTSVCVRTQFADLRQKMLVSCIFFREKYCGFRNLLYLCIRKNKF